MVLTQQEVIHILSCVKTFHNYVFLSLVYACGLRLGEALALTVDYVDAQAMLLFPALGRGGKSGRAVSGATTAGGTKIRAYCSGRPVPLAR